MIRLLFFVILIPGFLANAQVLKLPPRPADAPSGRAFAASVSLLPREAREDSIFHQIVSGNVPAFMRNLVPVTVHAGDGSTSHTLTYLVIPDYLAIGSDQDYVLMPMTPMLAQRIADTTRCSLPTRKMVDDIYRTALVKLTPQPIPPSEAMVTVPVFLQHNDSVWQQRLTFLGHFPLGILVGGDKKDVIISNAIYSNLKPATPRPVVIYGWHKPDGTPIQPVYNGHLETWADYSHGIRLVQKEMLFDGKTTDMATLLADPSTCAMLSDEGIILLPRYGGNQESIPPQR